MNSEIVQIKRYPNRRLYDRKGRKYVTLQDLEDLVRQGHTIDIRDSKTGEDLTRVILTQILLERHPERMEMFPTALLHCILGANDLALEFLRCFLEQSLATLERFQKATTLSPFLSPFEWMKTLIPGFAPGPRESIERSAESSRESLARRVAELEERIKRLETTPGEQPSPPVNGASHEPSEPHIRALESRLPR